MRLRGIPVKGSIPAVNRQGRVSLDRISSMRAATRTGFTFVGGHVGSISRNPQQSTKDSFTPHVTAPDPKVAKMRQTFQAAATNLANQFEALRQMAEDVGEMTEVEFWEAAIARLKGKDNS